MRLNADGTVKGVEKRERFTAHRVIEEFMILANVAAAEELGQKRQPRLYRVHDTPAEDKLEGVREYLASLDYSLIKGGSIRPNHFQPAAKNCRRARRKRNRV